MDTTKLSSKGQVVLPNSIREALNWKPGMELAVANRPDRVLLRPLKPFVETQFAQVVGSSGYRGARKSLKDMDDAVVREAGRGR